MGDSSVLRHSDVVIFSRSLTAASQVALPRQAGHMDNSPQDAWRYRYPVQATPFSERIKGFIDYHRYRSPNQHSWCNCVSTPAFALLLQGRMALRVAESGFTAAAAMVTDLAGHFVDHYHRACQSYCQRPRRSRLVSQSIKHRQFPLPSLFFYFHSG